MLERVKEKERANMRIPRRKIDINEKDEETVNLATKFATISENPLYKPMLESETYPQPSIEKTLFSDLPEPGKILIEEIMKVMYLNNLSPKKVI